MKIVIIGAGSRSFGLGQIAGILQCRELQGRNVVLSLVDENEPALKLMTQVATRIKGHTGSDIRLESATDRGQALPNANYVIVSVARRRQDLWDQDYRIPLSYGFKHILGENGGPGALFHALRSFELLIPICRDVEKLCPEAWLLNFTNPEARVLHAIRHLTQVKALGLCHGVYGAIHKLSAYLNKKPEEMDIISAGMNHFYCLLQVKDRATGEDLLPQAIKKATEDLAEKNIIFRKFAEIFNLFIMPSDTHTGEYLTFGSEFQIKWHCGRERNKVHIGKDLGKYPDQEYYYQCHLKEYAEGKHPGDDPKVLAPSGEDALPIICDIELDRHNRHPAVNVLNTGGYIENLPRDIVVEVPGTADKDGVHPLAVGSIPETLAAFMRPQFTIHNLLTEAYRTRSKKLLLQALLLDPVVNSITQAEKMLDEMLELQSEFLPTFS